MLFFSTVIPFVGEALSLTPSRPRDIKDCRESKKRDVEKKIRNGTRDEERERVREREKMDAEATLRK